MTPARIQLQRTKGWRMPPATVKVDSSTRWGNPFASSERTADGQAYVILANGFQWLPDSHWTEAGVVTMHEAWVRGQRVLDAETGDPLPAQIAKQLPAPPDLRALAGKNLACWCKHGQPCHAETLLRLAAVTPIQPPSPK